MKATNNYLEQHAQFPLQIIAGASSDLHMVIVVPCRAQEEVRITLESIAHCADSCRHAEVILVIYSDVDDGDEVLQCNTRIFRETDQWNRTRGSALKLFLLDFQHLPASPNARNTAMKVGLDEGVQRLEDARNPTGLLMVMEPGSRISGGTFKALMASASLTPTLGSFQLRFFAEGEGQQITHNEAVLRYLRMGLARSGYPLAMPVPSSVIALRSMVYQLVGGLPLDKQQPLTALAHRAVLEIPATSVRGGVIRVPEAQLLACLPAQMDMVPHMQSFTDLGVLIKSAGQLFGATSPNAFNRIAASLPQSVLAYLIENDGYHLFQGLRTGCANPSRFERQLIGWLEPGRVWDLLMQCGEHFYGMVSVSEGIESLMKTAHGATLPVLSDDYLLGKCRQWEMEMDAEPELIASWI